jgi:hypothetical protein
MRVVLGKQRNMINTDVEHGTVLELIQKAEEV